VTTQPPKVHTSSPVLRVGVLEHASHRDAAADGPAHRHLFHITAEM